MAQYASDYRLDPLAEDDKNWMESHGIDLDCKECYTYLESLDNFKKISGSSREHDCPLQAQLEHTLTTQFCNNLPKPKDKNKQKNLVQYVMCKTGLDFLKGRCEKDDLPKLHELIAKYTVDPYYRAEPLSEDERRYIGPLGIDLNNEECIAYLDGILKSMHAQTEQSVNDNPDNEPLHGSTDSSQNSLLEKLKKKFLVGNIREGQFPKPRDEKEKKNLIQQIIYKVGIEVEDEGEYDILLLLPDTRQIIGKF